MIRNRLSCFLRRCRAEEGQSTVEFALMIPAMLIAAVVGYNALMFFGNCAVFDRAFKDAVRVYASADASAVGSETAAQVKSAVESQLDAACTVAVTSGSTSRGFTRYEAVLTFVPSLFGRPMRGEVFGVTLANPVYRTSFVIDTLVTG